MRCCRHWLAARPARHRRHRSTRARAARAGRAARARAPPAARPPPSALSRRAAPEVAPPRPTRLSAADRSAEGDWSASVAASSASGPPPPPPPPARCPVGGASAPSAPDAAASPSALRSSLCRHRHRHRREQPLSPLVLRTKPRSIHRCRRASHCGHSPEVAPPVQRARSARARGRGA